MPSNLVKPFSFVFYLQINFAPGKQKRERETARNRDWARESLSRARKGYYRWCLEPTLNTWPRHCTQATPPTHPLSSSSLTHLCRPIPCSNQPITSIDPSLVRTNSYLQIKFHGLKTRHERERAWRESEPEEKERLNLGESHRCCRLIVAAWSSSSLLNTDRCPIISSSESILSPIFDPEPSTHRSTNPRTDLWPKAFDPRAFDFAVNQEPSRHEPTNRTLSLCDFDFLFDFDRPTNRSTFLCDFDFLLSLWSLIFLLLLWWWCGWWWKIVFSKCYQTHENIFQNNFHNTTKHLKIFSFPENIIFGKYFILNQTKP